MPDHAFFPFRPRTRLFLLIVLLLALKIPTRVLPAGLFSHNLLDSVTTHLLVLIFKELYLLVLLVILSSFYMLKVTKPP